MARYVTLIRFTDQGARAMSKSTARALAFKKAAGKAGIGPGMKIVAVNGRQYSADVLRGAIRDARTGGGLELLVQNGKAFTTHKLNYRDGERYPALERNNQPALLDEILNPLSPAPR